MLVGNNVSVINSNVITDVRENIKPVSCPTANIGTNGWGWWKDNVTGLIFQWGQTLCNTGKNTFTLPIAFPHHHYCGISTRYNASDPSGYYTESLSQGAVFAVSQPTNYYFFAVGD